MSSFIVNLNLDFLPHKYDIVIVINYFIVAQRKSTAGSFKSTPSRDNCLVTDAADASRHVATAM